MASVEDILSQRLVIVDFYMAKPTAGLDPCYSDFRGRDIKKVPIIRVFGSNAAGQKTCMHVHGVFPYFYIPFERKAFESLSQAFYQIAINVDKAINISLGQASSGAQHVFKVQLVKGIPFYGYHRGEHQFLKIYMFNPRFVRRAANLLQNGAILGGKVFHPHESHVPYVLQFMIDYNLYGMSFLHVPLEVVKFRRSTDDEVITYPGIQPVQILNSTHAKKQSNSSLEVDISANFILNRFQLITKDNSLHSNPGIESIWRDEQIRREKLLEDLRTNDFEELQEIPPLEVPATQERPNVQSVDSEVFYRSALLAKLQSMEASLLDSGAISEGTFNGSLPSSDADADLLTLMNLSHRQQKRTFNLKKLLGNAIYPEECAQDELMTNASYIENHLSRDNIFKTGISNHNPSHLATHCDSVHSEEAVVDEELILSLTQQHVPLNASLREEDFQLLDVLEQLEEVNVNEDHVDLDSSLAPLTQSHEKFPQLLDKEAVPLTANQPASDNESELENQSDENINDFTMTMDDIGELITKLTQNQPTIDVAKECVPQIDGSDDLLRTPSKLAPKNKSASSNSKLQNTSPRTPKKTPHKKHCQSAISPTRSPRTPKSSGASVKYAPLPVVIMNKSQREHELDRTRELNSSQLKLGNEGIATRCRRSMISLRKRLLLNEVKESFLDTEDVASTSNEPAKKATADDSIKICKRRSLRTRNLDKTHITCALTPMRSTERKLKTEKCKTIIKSSNSKAVSAKSCNELPLKTQQNSEACGDEKNDNIEKPLITKKCRNLKQHKILESEKLKLVSNDVAKTNVLENDVASPTASVSKLESTDEFEAHKTVDKNNSSGGQDEVLESDNEVDSTAKRSCRTPNLKSLRRSFRVARKNNSPTTECFPANKKSTVSRISRKTAVENDLHVQSFCDKSFSLNSPSVFSDLSISSPVPASKEILSITPPANKHHITVSQPIIMTPLLLPPTYAEVIDGCRKFEIPELEFQQPYYSDPADVTQKKEIGTTVLAIPSNKLNDCMEFESILGSDLKGINSWRQHELLQIGGRAMLNLYRSTQKVREYCASEKSIFITPQTAAPSKHDAKIWLKARELMSGNEKTELLRYAGEEEDSPIKVRRQKVTMIINDDGGGGSDADADMDSSACNLTLTPMTPASIRHTRIERNNSGQREGGTPLTTHCLSDAVSNKRKRARKSLLNKLKDSLQANDDRSNSVDSKNTFKQGKCVEEKCPKTNQDKQLKSSQSSNSSSIGSQEINKELERSSFVKNLKLTAARDHNDISFGLSSASLNNTFGFKMKLENLQQAKADIECNYLTTLMLEVFVPTRGDFYPNPEYDEIRCIFYAIENSIPPQETQPDDKTLPTKSCGYIIVNDYRDIIENEGKRHGIDADIKVQIVSSEVDAMQTLLELCKHWDPDIYAGYEIEMASWGYIMERSKHLNLNVTSLLSRVPAQTVRDFVDEDRDQFTDLDVELKLCGRILLDVWRLMRSEIALTSYTFENVMYHIMHKRCPWHSYRDLTTWFASPCSRWIVIEYYLERVRGTLAMLEQLDLIGRTSEMAKLIGIQFYEVLSRGSQFRVESMMLRIAKPKNLVPLSPSVKQRAHMRAPEYLPLIMEPLSRFYADPVIVLDFQSLYPSMIIAYNYCFSTCLGRVEHLGQSSAFEFGASQLRVSPTMLRRLLDEELVTISPCGVVFVKPKVREGILPRMLTEILDTRQMVKQSMKLHKSNTALQRILHSRQLGLKLMANVTYGYTAANFSGRMPAVEVGDSVVSKGRETLERAIKMVEANDRWNVRVVYGDTDSMFVQVPGRSRAKAFEIGAEIAEAVTNANPHPVKLKLEKVYQPCILQTKKRYVGYMYETTEQNEPIYEAKGIETVRRDGCPATAKMLEKVLRILFETADVSQVKQYVCRQFTKLLSGRANLQDLIFAKEFRGLNGYKPTACVPALEIARKWIQIDPRRIPRRGERVPFVIINGPPGVPLIRLVRSPNEVLADEGLKINAIYYITKAIIPPLNRCLLLIGADVFEWFTKLPRKMLTVPAFSTLNEVIPGTVSALQAKKSTISQYFSATNCVIDCGRHTKNGICNDCQQDATKSCVVLCSKMRKIERGFQLTQQICQACCGRVGDIKCGSLDCPVLYVLEVKRRELQQIVHFQNLLQERVKS